MEKAVATTGANPRAPGPRAPGNRDTLMVGQTVHPDIPNEATLQAYGAYVESDESDDESIFSINSLPNLLFCLSRQTMSHQTMIQALCIT